MSNIDRHPECRMRTALGNCDPIGGFCTSVNESVCEGLHKVSRPQGKWIYQFRDSENEEYKCSECDYPTAAKHNYCPNCGADMREREGE